MSLYSNLLDRLTAIRDEREMHANTASRVGQALIDILNAFTGKFLSRIYDDSAEGKITFKKGFQTDNFEQGQSGADVDASGRAELSSLHVRETTQLSGDVVFGTIQFQEGVSGGAIRQIDNDIHAEVDYLSVRKKMSVTEVEIQEVNYVGGSIVLSPADGFTITGVEYSEDYNIFYVYFDIEDSETGISTRPKWQVGDFAFSERFNAQNTSGDNIIHRWWREVVGIGGQVTDESSQYYGKYCIWLGNNEYQCEDVWDGTSESHLPMVGDKVVMLGNRNDASRQGAIILASAGGSGDPALPYIRVYRNIYTFDLSQATLVHQISYAGLITNTQNWNLNVDLGSSVKTVPFNTLYKEIDDIASQMDESFRVWHVDYDNTTPPSLSNLPASQWGGQDPYSEHVGDFCITSDGFCYEFKNLPETDENVYGWVIVTDQYLISYVEQIGEKKRIFPSRPSNNAMYEVGDVWLNAVYPDDGDAEMATMFKGEIYDNVTLVCIRDKSNGFDIDDWGIAEPKTTWLHQWQTGATDQGGASHNMFIGTNFGKLGRSTYGNHDVIYEPREAAGFRIEPTSAAIQLWYRRTDDNTDYGCAELRFDIDKTQSQSTAKLKADNIALEGYTTINDSFGVDLDGNMWAKNGRFGGLVTHEQTIITEENYEEYGDLVTRTYIDSHGYETSCQDYYVDITKCGQHISVIGVDGITTDSRIVLQLPFVCDYRNDGTGTLVTRDFYSYIADAWKYWDYDDSQLADINDVTKRYISSRELFKARSYVGCVVSIANYTICDMYILGVKGYGQTYYKVDHMTSVSNFDQLVSLKCVIRSADFTQITTFRGNEEIVWEATSMKPRLVMASEINTEPYYYVGKDEEYKESGHYSEDPLQNEFDQDVIDNYESGMFDDESNNNLIPDEPPIVQPTLADIENRYINTQGVWYARYYSVIVDVSRVRGQYISANAGTQYAFLTSYNDTNVTFVSGGSRVGARPNHVLIPNDAVYIYLYLGTTMPTVAPVFTLSEE